MSDFHETTADNLKAIREEKEMTQSDVAAVLGLEKHNISKIETGTRGLSDAEKKILDWYFFGTVPARIHGSTIDLSRMLEFDEVEWRIIGHIARRQGLAESEWIAARIRDYLALIDAPAAEKQAAPANPNARAV